MKNFLHRYTIDWGHLVFLLIIGCMATWYLLNAMSVSMDVHNLLLVGPVAVVAIGLCLVIIPQCFKGARPTVAEVEKPPELQAMAILGADALQTSDKKSLLLIGSVAAALGAYVFLLNVIGFDIATWLFAFVVMFICGERRPLPLLIYPILVSLVVISAFRWLLPFPMYTVIL